MSNSGRKKRTPTAREWHEIPPGAAAERLAVDPAQGLTAAEAEARVARHGYNEIPPAVQHGPGAMLAGQFTDFMIMVLIAAAIISGLIGDLVDTVAILTIVVLNALIGFAQEFRAERAVAALRSMAAPGARVLRDGRILDIPARGLVPGDVVLLEAGNAVPADLRLIECAQLRIEEAALTGESSPSHKSAEWLARADATLGDRHNMAYKGTLVTYGRGRGVVTATGTATELGLVGELLRSAEEGRTPLQKRLTRFGRNLAVAVLVICAILFVTGLLRGEPLMLMLLTAISLAVAAIPEALPAVVSASLALGARKLAAQNALIRKLPAVETLGSVTFICADKTGTLTENRMRVEELRAGGAVTAALDEQMADREPWRSLARALALSNDADEDAHGRVLGDPTEVALYNAAAAAGALKSALVRDYPRVDEVPFEAERACMTTIHTDPRAWFVAYTKGAPERVLPLCREVLGPDGTAPIDRAALEAQAEQMAAAGLRVLAVAERKLDQKPLSGEAATVECDLTLLGLVGLLDPPRPEAPAAVAECRAAGITPVMITGDHPATARAIARRLGIIAEGGEMLTGRELERLSGEELAEHVGRVRVYARVAPEQKIRIVRALRDRGEFVAMTGDGVNDAPALKHADIGVAMGRVGTDVAREAGHMVLLDDNFATIVHAVREGRRIFDNIRKFIKYTMTSNSGEIWTIFLAPFLGMPIPLLPIHILWINLVTDGLPGLALVAEGPERGLMHRPPRPPNESIFAHGMWQHIIWVGLLMGGCSLLTQAWALHQDNAHWQTMVFTVLTLSQLGHVAAIRFERDSVFSRGGAANPALFGALVFTFVLQMATVYVPVLNPVFKTQPLGAGELAFCLAMSSVVFAGVEIEKWCVRRGLIYRA